MNYFCSKSIESAVDTFWRQRAANERTNELKLLICLWFYCLEITKRAQVAWAQTAPPAQPFQRLDGCAYKPQRWDDGDSFHVVLPDRKEVVFRLYFVDTPEEERVYADRIAEQAAYFGISPDAATFGRL